jgi:hypothetical protein
MLDIIYTDKHYFQMKVSYNLILRMAKLKGQYNIKKITQGFNNRFIK